MATTLGQIGGVWIKDRERRENKNTEIVDNSEEMTNQPSVYNEKYLFLDPWQSKTCVCHAACENSIWLVTSYYTKTGDETAISLSYSQVDDDAQYHRTVIHIGTPRFCLKIRPQKQYTTTPDKNDGNVSKLIRLQCKLGRILQAWENFINHVEFLWTKRPFCSRLCVKLQA